MVVFGWRIDAFLGGNWVRQFLERTRTEISRQFSIIEGIQSSGYPVRLIGRRGWTSRD